MKKKKTTPAQRKNNMSRTKLKEKKPTLTTFVAENSDYANFKAVNLPADKSSLLCSIRSISISMRWGAFLRVQKLETPEGSVATVVYKGTNKDGQVHGRLLAWSNNRVAYKNTVDYFRFGSYSLSNYRSMLPWSNNGIAGKNMVFTESRTATHYLDNVDWIPLIYDYVNKSGIYKSETWMLLNYLNWQWHFPSS
ncbi:hypothetical protein L3X38_012638 [Prunus dulcis]|uniref:Uncharacterized protein n=1 Tax=Prunus dulcis TaxID=3755 RepID=A0AAD4WM54_PRUDU|nr:hypothetical protein L3X38_012638 [Prunus dulcis]